MIQENLMHVLVKIHRDTVFHFTNIHCEKYHLKGLWHGGRRFSELCFPFLKGGNSAFIAAIASGLFRQTEYQSLE